jgi:hypothetical protein
VGQTGSRPLAPKDLGFASAYVFGAVCPSAGRAAALIMPICNTLAMNHHLREIGSQVAADAHVVVIGNHGCLRDGLEPVCRRSRLDPLALRGRLGAGFAGSVGGACYLTAVWNARDPRIQKITEIRISGRLQCEDQRTCWPGQCF